MAKSSLSTSGASEPANGSNNLANITAGLNESDYENEDFIQVPHERTV
jgi:hypothetical protein